MGRHGLSFEERPLTSGPSLSTKSHAGLVYLQLSPAIQKFDINQLSSKHMLFAIGLLAPQPRLIAISLWHQRKLPYWCTLVWNSHQLIPNKAYSPQGRLLRKRRDSVFRCGYDCTPLHPGPQFWGGTHASQRKPSSYCRLSSTNFFHTPGARRQDWVLGTMGFALHRDANFSRFKLILVEIATTRLIQRRVISYRLLVKVKILEETSLKETMSQCILLPAALSFSLIGLALNPADLE